MFKDLLCLDKGDNNAVVRGCVLGLFTIRNPTGVVTVKHSLHTFILLYYIVSLNEYGYTVLFKVSLE